MKEKEETNGVHFVLDRMGFIEHSFHGKRKDSNSVEVGIEVHKELAELAKNKIKKDSFHVQTLRVLKKLNEMKIKLIDSDVPVKNKGKVLNFSTKLDLLGEYVFQEFRWKIAIELKTTTCTWEEAQNQFAGKKRNDFIRGHPLVDLCKNVNPFSRACMQLFLMYYSMEKREEIKPFLIYCFSDQVIVFPLFTVYPELIRNQVEIYNQLEKWYTVLYGKE